MRRSVGWAPPPVYWGSDPEGVVHGSHNPNSVISSQFPWPRHLSQTRNERSNAKKAYRRFMADGYEAPNNGNVCLKTILGTMCFATVAAAMMWLKANEGSITQGGRRTRKQYKKRSTRSLSK